MALSRYVSPLNEATARVVVQGKVWRDVSVKPHELRLVVVGWWTRGPTAEGG